MSIIIPTNVTTSPPHPTGRTHHRLVWTRRVLLGLVVALVALGSIGAIYQAVATEIDSRTYPPSGQLVDVGGHRLHLYCVGTGSPTVVLEAGFGATSLDWSLVQPTLGATTRVCAYDRAGYGWSDLGPTPRTSEQLTGELHALLATAGIPGPYVLVAHSAGAMHAQVYADRYPADVAALVLLDPTPVELMARLTPEARQAQLPPAALFRLLQVLAPVGLPRLLALGTPYPWERLSPELTRQLKAIGFRSPAFTAVYEESRAFEASIMHAAARPLPTDLPLLVLVRGRVMGPAEQDAAGKAAQAELVGRSTNGALVVADDSGHFIHLERPDLVIGAVRRAVEAVRGGAPLAR